MTEWTGTSPTLARPPRATSSVSTAAATISPPSCPTGGEDIIDDQDALPGPDGVGVHLEGVGAVLQVVGNGDRLAGELPRLADQAEPGRQAAGDGRPEDEPAALGPDDQVDVVAAERVGQQFDRQGQPRRIGQQRRDVAEQDARLGEVGDVADQPLEVFHGVDHRSGQSTPRPWRTPRCDRRRAPRSHRSMRSRSWQTFGRSACSAACLRGENPGAEIRTCVVVVECWTIGHSVSASWQWGCVGRLIRPS